MHNICIYLQAQMYGMVIDVVWLIYIKYKNTLKTSCCRTCHSWIPVCNACVFHQWKKKKGRELLLKNETVWEGQPLKKRKKKKNTTVFKSCGINKPVTWETYSQEWANRLIRQLQCIACLTNVHVMNHQNPALPCTDVKRLPHFWLWREQESCAGIPSPIAEVGQDCR